MPLIAAGGLHSAALSSHGHVFVWGDNGRGQLGTGDSKDRAKPTRVALRSGAAVRTISAGAFSSFATTEDNVTLAWGYNGGRGR